MICLLLAIKARVTPNITLYLAAQLGTLVGELMVGLAYTRQSVPYRITYVIATFAVSFASWKVVCDAGAHLELLMLSGLSALMCGSATLLLMDRLTFDTCCMLVAGTLTVFFGTVLGLRFRYSRYRAVLGPLALLWVTLGFACLGFAIEAHRWDALSYWLTYVLGLAAFGWIGLQGRFRRKAAPSRMFHVEHSPSA